VNRFRLTWAIELVRELLLLVMIAVLVPPAFAQAPSLRGGFASGQGHRTSGLARSAQPEPATGAGCEAAGKSAITIACDYAEAPVSAANINNEQRIVLNRAVLSFKTKDENYMRVELTFTNQGTSSILHSHAVYLAIDDKAGQNQLRRLLPHVDFRRLAPGGRLTFADQLLVGGLLEGHYTVYLWIPDPDPSLEFNAKDNLLLNSLGVPDQKTGLNKLATFVVVH
jgi:hypothetical protein